MLYRKATFKDVEAIHKIINDYAAEGVMLSRARNTIYETLREYILAEQDGRIVGLGALHLVWDELAEIRSMAVVPGSVNSGVGRAIVERLIEEARELGVQTVFALTYQPGFFAKLGFGEVGKEMLSPKVWKECINCPKFPHCDEIAVVKAL
ncbi:MAG: N-acetyltransferase [Sporomusaceae bacterium]|nr:N-acetyltransferase [Sporomusaceae bacterium]